MSYLPWLQRRDYCRAGSHRQNPTFTNLARCLILDPLTAFYKEINVRIDIKKLAKNGLIIISVVGVAALIFFFSFKHFVLSEGKKSHAGFPRNSNRVTVQADSADSSSYDPFMGKGASPTDSVPSDPTWLDELYGPLSLVGLQIKFTRFAETSRTKEYHRQAGLDLAAALIRLYDRPWIERSGACAKLNLRDPVAIMQKVVAILTEIGCTPQDITVSTPMTQETMRQIVHKDLYTALLQVRLLSEQSDDETDSDLLPDELLRYIKSAVDTYGFSLEGLGLTESEQNDFNLAIQPVTD